MSIDPHFAPHSSRDLGPWKRWVEERLKYLASGRNLIERGSVAGGVVTILQLLTNPNSPLVWIDTDQVVHDGVGDVALPLTALPYSRTLIVMQNGDPLDPSEWTRNGPLVTIPAQTWFHADDVFSAYYATDTVMPDQQVPAPVITSPLSGGVTSDTTPTITGTGAVGREVTIRVDGTTVGTATVDNAGAWSVTVATALDLAPHTVTVDQAEPGGGVKTGTPVTFTVTGTPPLGSLTVRGTTKNTGALPPETHVGDFLVVAVRQNIFVTTEPDYSDDPRLTELDVSGTENRVWVGNATDLSPLVFTGTVEKLCVVAYAGGATVTSVTSDDDPAAVSVGPQPGSAAVAVIGERSSFVPGSVHLPSPWTVDEFSGDVNFIEISVYHWIDPAASATPTAAPTTVGAIDEVDVSVITLRGA